MSTRGWLAFAALGLIWGVPYYLIKLAVAEVSPLVVAFARLALAALLLLPIAWRRRALRGLGAHAGAILAFAVIEFVVPFTAISLGERWVDSSVAGILIAGVPLTVLLVGRAWGVREPLGTWRIAGLATGLLGVVTLLGFGSISGPWGWAGAGCMVLAMLGYAIGPLIIQRHFSSLDSIGPVACSQAAAALVLAVPAALAWPRTMPSATVWASLAVLGVLCSAVAMVLMFFLVKHAGPARAAVITYVNPMVASLLGVFLLHEPLGAGGVASLALILAGSWLAARAPAAPRP